jgi:hypothetical protein
LACLLLLSRHQPTRLCLTAVFLCPANAVASGGHGVTQARRQCVIWWMRGMNAYDIIIMIKVIIVMALMLMLLATGT